MMSSCCAGGVIGVLIGCGISDERICLAAPRGIELALVD
jgi:hypothetical protein